MKTESQETQPTRVSRHFGAKQAGEVRARWAWTEPTVWTDRMLTALERGVQGGVWFSLIDKVYNTSNLQAAFAKVKVNGGAAGCDHQTIAMYETHLETNLEDLADQLRRDAYRPGRGGFVGCIFPNRADEKVVPWEFRRFVTGSYRRPCAA